jgi:hypothetical protein
MLRLTMRVLGLAGLLALTGFGCGEAPADPGTATLDQNGKNCPARGCTSGDDPNGRGIHIARTTPQSQYGIHNSDGSFKFWMTHFENFSGKIVAVGWYIDGLGTAVQAKSDAISATFKGSPVTLLEIDTEGSLLVLTLRDSGGNVFLLKDKDVVGVSFNFALVTLDRRQQHDFRLNFDAADPLKSATGDLYGYSVSFEDRSLGDAPKPLCQNALTGAEPNVFIDNAAWHPITSDRSGSKAYTTITCQSGAVAVCPSWGYRPWATAYNLLTAADEPLVDAHQACIQMKRAAYCGGAQAFTVEGTKIMISDTYDPAFNRDLSPVTEAVWSPSGALCVSNPRHDPATYFASACGASLPQCTGAEVSFLTTSLP